MELIGETDPMWGPGIGKAIAFPGAKPKTDKKSRMH